MEASISIRLLYSSSIILQGLKEFIVKIKASLEVEKFAYKVAKARQAVYTSRPYKVLDHTEGLKLCLSRSY